MIAGRKVVTFRSASSPSGGFVGLKPHAWTSSARPAAGRRIVLDDQHAFRRGAELVL